MVTLVEGLPSVLGALAALTVGFISLTVEVSLGVFVGRVVSALIVFWTFGIVLRALLVDAARAVQSGDGAVGAVEFIRPGTPVSALLEDDSATDAADASRQE